MDPQPDRPATPVEEKQCRICFDGPDPTLGKLIRPCLCKGSISHVHVKCLQRWRKVSQNKDAFFVCPQCRYRYHFARTNAVGMADNTLVIAAVATLLFVALVLCASFVSTYILHQLDDSDSSTSTSGRTLWYSSYWMPYDLTSDLLRAVLRILKDKDETAAFLDIGGSTMLPREITPRPVAGILKRLITRFVLGLPVVGIGSFVHMMLSLPFIGPLHWLARTRAYQRRNRNTSDLVALVVVVLVLVGAVRTLLKVYDFTQRIAKRMLLRAEDAILEVS